MHGIFDDDLSVVLPVADGVRGQQSTSSPFSYQFFNVDQIYDAMLALGVRPIVELSFMPGLFANCRPWPQTAPSDCHFVMHYLGVIEPPRNFSQWEDLVAKFGQHLVNRYGLPEVSQWYFEVWNELWGMNFPTDYLQLYDHARRGLKSVSTQLKVGGPVTMQCQYIEEFVASRAGQFDFVSTHLYPTDPNCTSPSSPYYGEADCFAKTIRRAKQFVPAGTPFFLTEYNAGLFDAELLYSSYAAAFVWHHIPMLHRVTDIWSYWTFSDIFEENGMHSAPFEGFNYGAQTFRGVKKPVYRAFQLLHRFASTVQVNTTLVMDGGNGGDNATLSAFATLSYPD